MKCSAECCQSLPAGMDWTNCLLVDLSAEEGPTLMPVPAYPFFCASAHHVLQSAHSPSEGLVVADFGKNGPHFFDWEDLHEQARAARCCKPGMICDLQTDQCLSRL